MDELPSRSQLLPDPALLPRDPALLPRDPALLPRDPALLPRDPALLPRDPALLPPNQTLLPRDPALLSADPALLLPHTGTAIWLEAVMEQEPGIVVCAARLPKWLLDAQEQVSTILGLELAAQAAAVCIGSNGSDSSGAPEPGYVAQVNVATFETGWFTASARLEVRARITDAVGRARAVRAEVFSDGALAMACELLLVASGPGGGQ